MKGIVWQEHGLITLCVKNWPKFPPMPEVAGLYRITLNDGQVYIGEAQSLKRRLYEYRRPTPGIEQEHRVHAAIVAVGGGKTTSTRRAIYQPEQNVLSLRNPRLNARLPKAYPLSMTWVRMMQRR